MCPPSPPPLPSPRFTLLQASPIFICASPARPPRSSFAQIRRGTPKCLGEMRFVRVCEEERLREGRERAGMRPRVFVCLARGMILPDLALHYTAAGADDTCGRRCHWTPGARTPFVVPVLCGDMLHPPPLPPFLTHADLRTQTRSSCLLTREWSGGSACLR